MDFAKMSDLGLAQILWDYMKVGKEPVKSDVMVVFGTIDITVAKEAARLFLEGYADRVIFSGGLGKATHKFWNETEARKFARVAMEMGVPEEKILLEEHSTNTGDNVRYSKEMIERELPETKTILAVCKPYMERRVLAVFEKLAPKFEVTVASEEVSLQDYNARNKDGWIDVMVGDVQRMKLFAEKGWQAPVEMPDEVWAANEELIRRGYDEYVLNGVGDEGRRAAAEERLKEVLGSSVA